MTKEPRLFTPLKYHRGDDYLEVSDAKDNTVFIRQYPHAEDEAEAKFIIAAVNGREQAIQMAQEIIHMVGGDKNLELVKMARGFLKLEGAL